MSGFVALDVDSYAGGDTSLHELCATYRPLPDTVQQLTGGGGLQYLFVHPGVSITNTVGALGPGLDVRGDGGYIIAPPSLHRSGRHYAWELAHHPEDTPLALMPDWLVALCQATKHRPGLDAGTPIAEGQCNRTLFVLGCSMRARGLSDAAIRAALEAINTTQCVPPLTETLLANSLSGRHRLYHPDEGRGASRYRLSARPPHGEPYQVHGHSGRDVLQAEFCLSQIARPPETKRTRPLCDRALKARSLLIRLFACLGVLSLASSLPRFMERLGSDVDRTPLVL